MDSNLTLQVHSTQDPVGLRLAEFEKKQGADFWTYGDLSKRAGAHSLISYPAMMLPSLQGLIMKVIKSEYNATQVLDPFVGSGTTLVESMMNGLNFTGIDINPLAVLSSTVKSGPYYTASLESKYTALLTTIKSDPANYIPRDFLGAEKWFHPKTASELELISRKIRNEESLWARRIFWLALSRAVRTVSNSRLSTYKLHKRELPELNVYRNAIHSFESAIIAIVQALQFQRASFLEAGLISKQGHYKYDTNIIAGNSINTLRRSKIKFDLVMTSPPYGDNRTTIPYGQFSYLPLQWIDLNDIQLGISKDIIENSHRTDFNSLGGSLKLSMSRLDKLIEKYPSAKRFAHQIAKNENGLQRFSSFFNDLDIAVEQFCLKTKGGGYHSWTVGNRRINDIAVPMSEIVSEMLSLNGVDPVVKISREIRNKKMPSRNKTASTMKYETILLGKKRRSC